MACPRDTPSMNSLGVQFIRTVHTIRISLFIIIFIVNADCRRMHNFSFSCVCVCVAAKGKKINRLCNSVDGNLNARRSLSYLFMFFSHFFFSCGGRFTSRGMCHAFQCDSLRAFCVYWTFPAIIMNALRQHLNALIVPLTIFFNWRPYLMLLSVALPKEFTICAVVVVAVISCAAFFLTNSIEFATMLSEWKNVSSTIHAHCTHSVGSFVSFSILFLLLAILLLFISICPSMKNAQWDEIIYRFRRSIHSFEDWDFLPGKSATSHGC